MELMKRRFLRKTKVKSVLIDSNTHTNYLADIGMNTPCRNIASLGMNCLLERT